MPRPNRERTIGSERSLAARLAHERQANGWTYEALAKRMDAVGCTIQPSALYKIENGDPPRRVTVDEFVALSNVLEVPLDELLLPVSMVREQEALSVAKELVAASHLLNEGHAAVLRAAVKLVTIAEASPDLFEFVTHQFIAGEKDRKQWFAEFVGGPVNSMSLSYLAELADRYWNEVMRMVSGHTEEATD